MLYMTQNTKFESTIVKSPAPAPSDGLFGASAPAPSRLFGSAAPAGRAFGAPAPSTTFGTAAPATTFGASMFLGMTAAPAATTVLVPPLADTLYQQHQHHQQNVQNTPQIPPMTVTVTMPMKMPMTMTMPMPIPPYAITGLSEACQIL